MLAKFRLNRNLCRQDGLTSQKSEANKFTEVFADAGDKNCFDLSCTMALCLVNDVFSVLSAFSFFICFFIN